MADTTGDHPATRSPGGDAHASLTGPRPLSELKPKAREPGSVSILTQWINRAERTLGVPAAGGRLGWLVASTVAIAALSTARACVNQPAYRSPNKRRVTSAASDWADSM